MRGAGPVIRITLRNVRIIPIMIISLRITTRQMSVTNAIILLTQTRKEYMPNWVYQSLTVEGNPESVISVERFNSFSNFERIKVNKFL